MHPRRWAGRKSPAEGVRACAAVLLHGEVVQVVRPDPTGRGQGQEAIDALDVDVAGVQGLLQPLQEFGVLRILRIRVDLE